MQLNVVHEERKLQFMDRVFLMAYALRRAFRKQYESLHLLISEPIRILWCGANTTLTVHQKMSVKLTVYTAPH